MNTNQENENEYMESESAPIFPVNSQIPIDFLVSTKHLSLKSGGLKFTDASGTLVFKFDPDKRKRRILLDAEGNPLFSIYRNDGVWQGYRGDNLERKDLIFRVERTLHSLFRTELEVFLVGENWGQSKSNFNVIGCPFQRSCTIYRGNSIVAQSSLLYKLGKVIVGRRRFRLTIFPGFADHALVVSILVIFLNA